MKKIIAAFLVVCLIFTGVWVIPVVGEFGDSNGMSAPRVTRDSTRGNTLYVGSNQTYTSIMTAIDAANAGDTVYVYSGTYTETGQWYYDSNGYDHYAHFLIRKSITLIGEDKNTTIIEGNYYGHVIDVRASNVTISGFTVRKSGNTVYEGRVGLQFNDADNCIVTGNIFTDNYVGVGTHRNHRLTIKNNEIYSNKIYGIQIHMYSPADKGDTIIDSNEIYNNGDGIYQRFHYYGPGTITNNKIYNNTHGIDFLASYDKIIAGNEIIDNKIGIYFERGINNTIKNNVIKSNQQYGIYIDRYYPYANYYAPSENNHIYHNYLISNGVQAYENNSLGNDWNHTTLKEGNYWSDYEYMYPEAGNDGKIWKIPYNITGNTNATDYYPLCNKTSQIKIPPTITTKDKLKAFVGKSYSVIYYAYDPDTPQGKLTWTMKTNASWLNFSTEQKLNGTPSKSDIGSYWIHISVSDGNSSDYTNFTLTVLDFGKPQITTNDVQSAFVGKLYLVKYSATDPDTAKEKLTWTMRSNASWLNFSSKQEIYGTPSKADIGTYWIYISVSDGIKSDSTNFTLTVRAFGVPQIITIDVLTTYVGERYSVNYSATDSDTPAGNLTWTMKSNASWLNFSVYQVLYGTPSKSDIGSYWINISVSDGNNSDYTYFILTVKSKETFPKGNGTVIILRTGQKFTRIQPAIDKAISGDTIYVYNGTYTETGQWYYDSNGYDHYAHFLIRKSITLIGENKNTTIIEGNYYGHVMDVRASNVTITGFTIRKSGNTVYEGRVGLQFNDADNCVATGNIFTDNYVGVGTHRNHRLTIKNNEIYSNKVYGIQIHMYSPADKGDTIIDSNEIYNNGIGIYQRFHYDEPGSITNNKIYNNDHGIDFLASHDKIIDGNEIKNNKIGIYFEGAINNTIKDNIIISNRNYGLYLTDYNPYAGYERPSFDNVIYHNDIISNGVQAYDYKSGVNNWNSTKIKEGNYWSDYITRYPKAKSIGGIWDTPYDIKDRAKDLYPLANMTTYEGPEYEVPEPLPTEITNISIKQNSTNILINTSEVIITFSKPMNRTEVESSLSISPSVKYTLAWEKHNTVLRIIFTENLTYNTTYTILLKLVTEGYSVNASYSPFKLVFTTEPGLYAGQDEETKNDVPIEVQVIFPLVICLIILFLIILAMITKNLRRRREELEKGDDRIESEDEVIVTNGIDEVIYELKKEAMVPDKPSAFGFSKHEMLENFNKKCENGEISKETFEIIKSSLTAEKPRK